MSAINANAVNANAVSANAVSASAASASAIVRTRDLVVDFSGFKAIQGLDFAVDDGELRFLIGPNGAGKTTLLDAICGRVRPTSGKVLFREKTNLARMQEHKIAQLGIGRKFQTTSIFGSLRVLDNLSLAAKGARGVLANLRSKSTDDDKLESCLQTVGLEARRETLAGALSHGEKQWLEIGMLLMQQPALLLLDEPAAGMTDEETHQMGELLQRLARDEHNDVRSILVVEHDMEFVRQFAHKVTVMHEGRLLREGTMDEVSNDERVQ